MSDSDHTDPVRASGAPLALTYEELEQLARFLERLHATAPWADLEPVEAVSRIVNRELFARAGAGEAGPVTIDPGCYL